MMACTSPWSMTRSRPLSISRSSTLTARFLISSNGTPTSRNFFAYQNRKFADKLSDRAFKADRNQLLGFDGELHRQLLQHVAHKAVDDQRHRILLSEAALHAVEQHL